MSDFDFDKLMDEHPNWSKLEIFRAGSAMQREKDIRLCEVEGTRMNGIQLAESIRGSD